LVIAHILGWGLLLAGSFAIGAAVTRRAAADGILVPLAVGVGLRLVVMLIAHAGSISLGDHGILFIDDGTHMHDASKLAGLWREGQVPDPVGTEVVGSFQFGYPAFVGFLYTLGTTSIIIGKLANVLIGGVTVLLASRIAGKLLGDSARLRAAWLTALAPTLIWWSAPLLKEALATMLVALGVLAALSLPRPRALATLGGVLAALLVVRSAAVLALVPAAAVAVAIAGRRAEGRWLSRPLVVFVAALLGSVVAAVLVVSHGDVHNFVSQYETVIRNMVRIYQGSSPVHVPYDALKSLVTPLPWTFDASTRNWDRGLYPGMWLIFCALPLAAIGSWRLRARPEGWLLFLTLAVSILANAFTSGFVFRQRSMVEPMILLLALAGARSWRMAARSASASLAVVAVVAFVDLRSPLVPLAIAAGAAGMLALSRWLPSRDFEALPDSPMVAGFRRSFERRSAGGPTVSPRRLAAQAAALRAAALRVAPRLALTPSRGAGRELGDGEAET
jgi:hypothetical protein